jgi:hypothetical protein
MKRCKRVLTGTPRTRVKPPRCRRPSAFATSERHGANPGAAIYPLLKTAFHLIWTDRLITDLSTHRVSARKPAVGFYTTDVRCYSLAAE